MAIYVFNGSSWEESSNPQVRDGSTWASVEKGEIYNGSSWEVFFTAFPGPAVAPTLTNSGSTLTTVTAGVSLSTPPPSGFSVRVKIRNATSGSGFTYLPSAAGTTGTISTTYTSSSLNESTSYTISAVSEYLKNGNVVATSEESSVTIATQATVAPTLSVSSKTTNSITIRVRHTGGVSRRLVIYRGGDPTVIDIPGFGAYTTSNIDTYLTFSGLSSNTRYFFYGYTVYQEGPTTSDTSSTFTKTTYYGSRVYVPSATTYASANETTYFSARAFGASSSISGNGASNSSDNNFSTSWIAEYEEEVPDIESVSRSVTAVLKSGTRVTSYSTSHGFTLSKLQYGPLQIGINYLITNISSLTYYPATNPYVICTVGGSLPINYNESVGGGTGSSVTVVGSSISSFNRTYTVADQRSSTVLWLSASTMPTKDSTASGGTLRSVSGTGGSITSLGGTYTSGSGAVLSTTTDTINVFDNGYTQDVGLSACSGSLVYYDLTGTTMRKKPEGGANDYETLSIAVRPNLPTGAINARLEAFRFYSQESSPDVDVYVNTAFGPYWQSSVSTNSGPYSVTGIPLGATIPPTASYGGVSNAWYFLFYVWRNSLSISSMREVEFQYSYQPLIDPGD